MPRVGRKAPGGLIYHVLNRGNGRQRLFHKPADYQAFIDLLGRVRAAVPVRVLGVCLMPNHWHLVLWPTRDGELSQFMLRLTTAHVRRRFVHRQDTWACTVPFWSPESAVTNDSTRRSSTSRRSFFMRSSKRRGKIHLQDRSGSCE